MTLLRMIQRGIPLLSHSPMKMNGLFHQRYLSCSAVQCRGVDFQRERIDALSDRLGKQSLEISSLNFSLSLHKDDVRSSRYAERYIAVVVTLFLLMNLRDIRRELDEMRLNAIDTDVKMRSLEGNYLALSAPTQRVDCNHESPRSFKA